MKLEDITVNEFIAIICGETEASPEIVRDLVMDYRAIVDPGGMKGHLLDAEELAKARMEVSLWTMCRNLIRLGEPARVREVMKEYGVNAMNMNEQRVAAETDSRLAKAKSKVAELEKGMEADAETEGSVRRQFDGQTAALMAHFKFQIDTDKMKASVYALLVARHNREIKAQLAALKKR